MAISTALFPLILAFAIQSSLSMKLPGNNIQLASTHHGASYLRESPISKKHVHGRLLPFETEGRHTLSACRCDVTNTCLLDDQKIAFQDELFVCFLRDDSLQILDILDLVVSQGSYEDEAISGGDKNTVTWITRNPSSNTTTIRTRLMSSQFFKPTFMGRPRENVLVRGIASVVMNGDDEQNLPENPLQATFGVAIPVESSRLLGFFKGVSVSAWLSLILIMMLALYIVYAVVDICRFLKKRLCNRENKAVSPSPPEIQSDEENCMDIETEREASNREEITRIWSESL